MSRTTRLQNSASRHGAQRRQILRKEAAWCAWPRALPVICRSCTTRPVSVRDFRAAAHRQPFAVPSSRHGHDKFDQTILVKFQNPRSKVEGHNFWRVCRSSLAAAPDRVLEVFPFSYAQQSTPHVPHCFVPHVDLIQQDERKTFSIGRRISLAFFPKEEKKNPAPRGPFYAEGERTRERQWKRPTAAANTWAQSLHGGRANDL